MTRLGTSLIATCLLRLNGIEEGLTMRLRTVALAGVGCVAVLGAVLVGRTLMVKSQTASAVALPAAPAVDIATAARHLGEAIRFRTVSH